MKDEIQAAKIELESGKWTGQWNYQRLVMEYEIDQIVTLLNEIYDTHQNSLDISNLY